MSSSSSFESNVANARAVSRALACERRAALHRRCAAACHDRANVRDANADRRQRARDGRSRRRSGRRSGCNGCGARVPQVARRARQRPSHSLAQDRGRDRGARRGDRAARVARHGPAHPLHGDGRETRRRELSLLRRQGARGRARLVAAGARARQLHDAPAARPRRGHHAVEHAVHAVDVEDRAGARGRLHGRAQARRMEPDHGHAACGDCDRGRACPPAC